MRDANGNVLPAVPLKDINGRPLPPQAGLSPQEESTVAALREAKAELDLAVKRLASLAEDRSWLERERDEAREQADKIGAAYLDIKAKFDALTAEKPGVPEADAPAVVPDAKPAKNGKKKAESEPFPPEMKA